MANPFNQPLPTVGQKPWTLNPVVTEMRTRQGVVEDVINTGRLSPGGLSAEIAEAAASVTVADETIANLVAEPTSETATAIDAKITPIADDVSDLNTLTSTGRLGEAALRATFVQAAEKAEFNVARYGNIEQAKRITDASMTAGSAVLSSTGYTFTSADVGKKVGVKGAGPVSTDYTVLANDGVLVSTIVSVSAGVATLADTATNTASDMQAVFGFPIDAAFIAATQAANAAGGGRVFIPAGTWLVSETLNYQSSEIIVCGAGRTRTRVYYVHTGVANSNSATPCFRGLGPTISQGGKFDASFESFSVFGTFFVSTGAWSSEMKLISLTYTVDAELVEMAIIDTPATAIGYDVSTRNRILNCTILQPGRLAPISSSFAGAAGSGIGIAIEQGSTVASCIIEGNFIEGPYLNPVGGGRTGIHLEGVYAATDSPSGDYIIANNVVKGFSIGIRDSGALGTIIQSNRISKCQWGIQCGTKGASSSRMPQDTQVKFNVIQDLVNRFAPSGTSYGILISTQTTTDNTGAESGRTNVHSNHIARVPGHGIYVRGNPYPLNHVMIQGNSIRDCDGCGINVEDVVNDLSIVHNSISGCGRAGGSTTNAIRIGASVVWTGGRIEGNDFSDYAASPTQLNSIFVHATAQMIGVRRSGNTDDPAQSAAKTSTTTINNNSTLATVSAFNLQTLPNTSYQFEALIEYTAAVAAGLKIKWALPDGATLNWTVGGAGAPDVGVLLSTSQAQLAGAGVGVLRAVRVQGLLKTGAVGGGVTLQASQFTADPTDATVTARSVMSAARA